MAYSSIVKPSDYFNTKLYDGNSGTQSITGVNFQPDFLWIKRRNLAGDHNLVDVIRTSDKTLISNSNGAEYSNSTITSFDSDGFSLSGSDGALNASGSNYVSWNWLGGGTASSNTDGSITSSVSANTTTGFSIVSYTGNGTSGATIGHGLGNVPKMIIIKQYSSNGGTENWGVYHNSIGNGKYLFLNLTNSEATSTGYWNNTTPTSSVFTLGNNDVVNNNTVSYIAYCFAEKKGYSKIGSYTGNGNADGPFIYTGFKPAFILSKKTNAAGTQWTIWDNKRSSSGFNPADKILHPNVANPDNTADDTDFLSNGFKLRATASGMNNSGDTYIYMAFAEEPLVANSGTDGVPATAR